jgi:hypothetical protein
MILKDIVKKFNIIGNIVCITEYGNGLINETYLVASEEKGNGYFYILQKINNSLFKDVDSLMVNIESVTNYISTNYTNTYIRSLTLIKTIYGTNYFYCDIGYYRMYDFIDGDTLEILENENIFYECGKAYGRFQKMLFGFKAENLKEILPNFHNTQIRYDNFLKSVKHDKYNRVFYVIKQIDFIEKRKDYCNKITDLLSSGKIPKRVIHGDTKLNNILYDKITKKSLAVIDLDTVMSGAACFDFGDSIRSGLLRSSKPLNVEGKLKFYESYLKGFLSGNDMLTQAERKSLLYGALVITYECGIRFLTDYLDGDIYFKTKYTGQNLEKTLNNFNLLLFLEENVDKLEKINNNI